MKVAKYNLFIYWRVQNTDPVHRHVRIYLYIGSDPSPFNLHKYSPLNLGFISAIFTVQKFRN